MKNIFTLVKDRRRSGFLCSLFCKVCISFLLLTMTRSLHGQWVQTNGPYGPDVICFAVSGTYLFAGTEGGGVFRSADNGANWEEVNGGLTNLVVHALAVSGINLFAGTLGGVFRSTDNGASWTAVNAGLTFPFVQALVVSGNNLFAGTLGGGVFRSTDNGASWTPVNDLVIMGSPFVYAFAVSGTALFAGTFGGVFRSTDNGAHWTEVNTGLTNFFVYALAVSGTTLFAGTLGGGVFRSTDNGASWTAVNEGLTNFFIFSLAVFGTNLFAGTSDGVFLSTDNGAHWTAVNEGLTATVLALAVSGTHLFAGTAGGDGVWRRPLSEMITSVERLAPNVPSQFALQQNFPNPFNATTTISFTLPKACRARLSVFDLLGNQVAVLVDRDFAPGEYQVVFEAKDLASGVYFYRLKAEDEVKTRKLVLIK